MADQLIMVRRTLDDLVEAPLAAGYAIRYFQPGDEEALTVVFQECFDPGWNTDRLLKVFLEDQFWSPQRMCVLTAPDGTVAGTASAWEARERPNHGLVHYVGILEAHRSRGLGMALVAHILKLLARMGYKDAWLTTDDFRLPAIHIYRELGFDAVYPDKSHRGRWEIIRHRLTAFHAEQSPDATP